MKRMKRMKLLNLFQKILVFLSLLVVIQNIFVILHRNCLMMALERVRKYRTGHYIAEKRHTMLCRLAIWNYHNRLQVNDKCRVDATGMLDMCIPLCAWRLAIPSSHTYGCISNTYAWVSPCSSTCKGCGRPQIADEQKVDTHVFLLCG